MVCFNSSTSTHCERVKSRVKLYVSIILKIGGLSVLFYFDVFTAVE